MRAVVVALGKIGLPLAAQLARTGHDVIGCDVDERVVDSVNAGRAPFPGEAHLEQVLARVVPGAEPAAAPTAAGAGGSAPATGAPAAGLDGAADGFVLVPAPGGSLRATADTRAAVATGPELVLLVPPLLVDADAQPDWRILDSVLADVAAGLHPGTTVALETTVPVGTTRGRVRAALEAGSGLVAEEDFHVVFSPERVYSGRVFADLATYPKLVGGLSAAGEARGVALYGAFLPGVEVRALGGAEAAELTKLVETTYRDVNIALANEFARHADALGLDVQAVIDAANSQPFSHVHRPGVAVGGHCIPVYPRFYLAGDPAATLPAAARQVNAGMPAYAVELLGEVAGQDVLILGVAYRGGVKETAFSGAFGLRDELRARGARPLATDPLYDAGELAALGFAPWTGGPVSAAVLQADHAEYVALTPAELPGLRTLVDGRGVLDPAPWRAAGVTLRRIGRP